MCTKKYNFFKNCDMICARTVFFLKSNLFHIYGLFLIYCQKIHIQNLHILCHFAIITKSNITEICTFCSIFLFLTHVGSLFTPILLLLALNVTNVDFVTNSYYYLFSFIIFFEGTCPIFNTFRTLPQPSHDLPTTIQS